MLGLRGSALLWPRASHRPIFPRVNDRDPSTVRDSGAKHIGEQRTSPYPMSRLAPVHDLVDVARQIAEADTMLGAVASAELTQIAEQMRALKERARVVLEAASESLAIHRARCSFAKKPGHTYHLYERADGERWLSMIGPAEWGSESADRIFRGSYRLELDQAFTKLDVAGGAPRAVVAASELLAHGVPRLGVGEPDSR